MAHLREHRDENGKLTAYYIRVYRGRGADGKQLKPYSMVFDVPETWSEATAKKKAEAAAAVFEEKCNAGMEVDTRQTFAQYAEYVLKLKEKNRDIKHSTLVRYRELLERINPEIGHLRLKDIRAQHLNAFYGKLMDEGIRHETATAKIKFIKVIEARKVGPSASPEISEALKNRKKLSQTLIGKASGVAQSTVGLAMNGEQIKKDKAERIANALGYSPETLFSFSSEVRPMAAKTILEHHRIISSILTQAEKESLVVMNVARKASPPKVGKKEVEFYEPEVVKKIKDAIDQEEIYWRTIAYLIIYTGARRGEILGLRPQDVDEENNRVHIVNNLQYTPDIGIYIETPKTEETRWVSVPENVIKIYQEYIAWKDTMDIRPNEKWQSSNLLFINYRGDPIHPDSVTEWFAKLEHKYDLPHIHPHAFRHSIASALI